MSSIARSPEARRLFITSILARLPLAMLGIGLLVQAQHLSGSFPAAGVVTGVYAVAVGVGGPLLGGLVDRRGQTSVLLVSAAAAAALLIVLAVQPVGASLIAQVALAAGVGLSTPPVGACLRARLPSLLRDASEIRAAFALEASVVELTFISGRRSRSASAPCGPPARLSRVVESSSCCPPRRSLHSPPLGAGRARRPIHVVLAEARCGRRRCGRWWRS
jgi:hypothetical protein